MENKSNESNVSINILIAQAKQEYISNFNSLNKKYNLPASIWSMILTDVLNQVNEISKQDLAHDLEELNKQNKKIEDKEDDGDGTK